WRIRPCATRVAQGRCGTGSPHCPSGKVHQRVDLESSPGSNGMLEELVGELIVLDLRSPYVCLGKLKRLDADFLEVTDADFHDLRDTQTTRENYVAASAATGIKRNRKRVLVARAAVVPASRLADVLDHSPARGC